MADTAAAGVDVTEAEAEAVEADTAAVGVEVTEAEAEVQTAVMVITAVLLNTRAPIVDWKVRAEQGIRALIMDRGIRALRATDDIW